MPPLPKNPLIQKILVIHNWMELGINSWPAFVSFYTHNSSDTQETYPTTTRHKMSLTHYTHLMLCLRQKVLTPKTGVSSFIFSNAALIINTLTLHLKNYVQMHPFPFLSQPKTYLEEWENSIIQEKGKRKKVWGELKWLLS